MACRGDRPTVRGRSWMARQSNDVRRSRAHTTPDAWRDRSDVATGSVPSRGQPVRSLADATAASRPAGAGPAPGAAARSSGRGRYWPQAQVRVQVRCHRRFAIRLRISPPPRLTAPRLHRCRSFLCGPWNSDGARSPTVPECIAGRPCVSTHRPPHLRHSCREHVFRIGVHAEPHGILAGGLNLADGLRHSVRCLALTRGSGQDPRASTY